jgi:hypothetical protein
VSEDEPAREPDGPDRVEELAEELEALRVQVQAMHRGWLREFAEARELRALDRAELPMPTDYRLPTPPPPTGWRQAVLWIGVGFMLGVMVFIAFLFWITSNSKARAWVDPPAAVMQ